MHLKGYGNEAVLYVNFKGYLGPASQWCPRGHADSESGQAKNKDQYGREVLRQINTLSENRKTEIADLQWFGVEVIWRDDRSLVDGYLNIKIWENHCQNDQDRRFLMSQQD